MRRMPPKSLGLERGLRAPLSKLEPPPPPPPGLAQNDPREAETRTVGGPWP